MIRVCSRFYDKNHDPVEEGTLVDADGGYVLSTQDISSTVLVLTKGDEEVAWFDGWVSAIKTEHLKDSNE
jgi:hypothetical protein